LFAEERIERNKKILHAIVVGDLIANAIVFVALTLCGEEQDDEEWRGVRRPSAFGIFGEPPLRDPAIPPSEAVS
jgi:hypothetical protein